MQRTYAFEDQRAVRFRVTLAVTRFRPLVTGGILPGRLIALTGYAHTTSVAGAAADRCTQNSKTIFAVNKGPEGAIEKRAPHWRGR